MADATFLFITVDCADPARLAAFWSALLETPVGDSMDDGRFVFLEGGGDLPVICFQRVPEPKSVKNRVHVDLATPDLDAELTRLKGLGATHLADHDEDGTRWATLADPEGNEFDVAVG